MKVKEIIKEMDSSAPKQYKITKQDQSGITLVDPNDPKTSITISPDQQQTAFKPDPSDPTKLTLDPNALAKSGTTNQQATPAVGATVNVATALPGQISSTSAAPSQETMGSEEPVEEDGNQEFDPSWVNGDDVPGSVGYLQPGDKGLSSKDPGVQTLYPAQMTPELRRKYQIANFQKQNPGVPLPVELGGPGMPNNESVELNAIRKLSGL